MIQWIEATGRSEEDAISTALFRLGLDRDDVSIEVLERAKPGFLGFGANPAKVRVSYELPGDSRPAAPAEQKPAPVAERKPAPVAEKKPAPVVERKPAPVPERKPAPAPERRTQLKPGDEVLIAQEPAAQPVPAAADSDKSQQIRTFLTGLMGHLAVEAVPDLSVAEDGSYKVVLQGQGLGAIIGRRGETLDAIQQLTNYAVNRGQTKRVRVHIDAESYRAKREESLQHLALRVADKVMKYHKNVTLEAMNAYERHVIHTALQDYPGVSTYSTGTEPNRRTVVAYSPDQQR